MKPALAIAALALSACATPSLDAQLTDRDQPRRHTVFRIDWRAVVAPATEADPPVELVQSRWEPLEPAGPIVVKLGGAKPFGEVVAGGSNGELKAFALSNGKPLWTFKGGGPMSSPAADGDRVFAGSGDGHLYAVSAVDGRLLWTYACNEELGSRPVFKDGLVFVQSHADGLFAIEAATGKWKWQYRRDPTTKEFTMRGVGTPALVKDLIVAGFSDGAAVALKTSDGQVVWQHVTPVTDQLVDTQGSPQTDGERVFVANYKDGLTALSVTDGRILWQKAFPQATQLRLGRGSLFASGVGTLAAFSPFDGSLQWQRTTGALSATSLTLFPGLLMVATDGPLYFLDARSGRALGRGFNPGRGIAAAPGLSGRGLYVLSNNGWLYAMHLL